VSPDEAFDVRRNIELAFDQPLLPLSVNRQSVGLRDANGNGVTSPVILYDPITRVVSIAPPAGGPWLQPGLAYKVVLTVPSGEDDASGLRSVGRGTLDPKVRHEIGFQTCGGTRPCPATPLPTVARVRFCNDVMPIFVRHCSGGICHGSPVGDQKPAASLVLDTSIGVAKTAIGRVAQGANTGASSGRVQPAGHLFGVDMAIVQPYSPANSWLMYKLAIDEPHDDGVDAGAALRPRCYPTESPNAPVDPFGGGSPFQVKYTRMSASDRAALADYVFGNPMPYPSPDNTVGFDEIERIRAWIEQGAVVEECGAC